MSASAPSCVWEFLQQWQTLITGIIAIAAAWYGGRKVVAAAGIQAKATTDVAKQQLEDGARPICVLMPYDGVDPWLGRDTLLAVSDVSPENPSFGVLELRCTLRNIGRGPAVNLAFRLRILEGDGYTSPPWELSPLHAGEIRGDHEHPIRVRIPFSERFNKSDFDILVGRQWQLVLVYKDVFGNDFYSVHHKTPRQLDKLYAEFGAQPVSVPQPWVTMGKGALLPVTLTNNGVNFP